VDFHPPAGTYSAVVAWLRQNHNGGVGTYSCGMNHIHIDNGPKIRFHKCQGAGRYIAKTLGTGKRRQYASRSGSRKVAGARSGSRYASQTSGQGRRVRVAARVQRRDVATASAGSITNRAIGGAF
jgi:hypothetical protein